MDCVSEGLKLRREHGLTVFQKVTYLGGNMD
jgi:hypothetical protein